MSRGYSQGARERLDCVILASINHNLEEMSKEIGWSKTKIVEDALFIWLSQRHKELYKENADNGLVKTR